MFTVLHELTKPSVGLEGLQQARERVQQLSDETNGQLKKNVYKNYALFIETAKEIAFLKSEMYSLSNLLSQEQNLLTSLLELSICEDKHLTSNSGEGRDNIKDANRKLSIKSPLDGDVAPTFDKLNVSIFEETDLLEEEEETDSEMIPMWLTELSEDLDVCIAQRAFEDAVNLVNKFNDHYALYPKLCDNPSQIELKGKINAKIENLIDAIAKELEIVKERPMQSGPRAARRAVNLLLRLGRSSLATDLFLNQRSAILRYCLMQQKKEGATLPYIKRMSAVFFTNVQESCKEFQRAFGLLNWGNNSLSLLGTTSSAESLSLNNVHEKVNGFSPSLAMACLVSWVKNKMKHFLDMFTVHVFTAQVPSTVASECVSLVYQQCKKLRSSVHIDLIFYCDQRLKSGIERIINESRDKLLEGIKQRCNNDRWNPQNFGNKASLIKFLEDMKDAGFSLNSYSYDECKLSLTSNTTSFVKSYFLCLCDLVKLSTPLTHKLVINALVAPMKAHLRHIERSLKDDKLRSQQKIIATSAAYILDNLLPMSIDHCKSKFGAAPEELLSLSSEYAELKIELPNEPVRPHRTSSSDRQKSSTLQRTRGPSRERKTYSTTTYL